MQPQPKCKDDAIPERRVILLKKRSNDTVTSLPTNAKTVAVKAVAVAAPTGLTANDNGNGNRNQLARRVPPMAKILPEAKRSLAEHLKSTNNNGLKSQSNSGHNQQISSNTAVIKPVIKRDTLTKTAVARCTSSTLTNSLKETKISTASTVPTVQTVPAMAEENKITSAIIDQHSNSLHSDDEVQLDYDEDDLLLDEEEMLLATPDSSPKRSTVSSSSGVEDSFLTSISEQKQQQQQHDEKHCKLSSTPSPPLPSSLPLKASVSSTVSGEQSSLGTVDSSSIVRHTINKDIESGNDYKNENKSVGLGSSNRRVILRSSIDSFKTTSTLIISDSRRSSGNGSRSHNAATLQQSSARKGIFDRLEGRNTGAGKHLSSGNNGKGNDGASSTISVENDYRRKSQRIVLKHNWD